MKTVKFVVWIDGLFRPELWTWQEREALKAELKALEYWAAKDPEWSKLVAGVLPNEAEAPLSDYYSRDLKAIFRKELDRVESRAIDPDVPVLARMQRSPRLGRTQNQLTLWKALCLQRRLSETKSTGPFQSRLGSLGF